MIPTISVGGLAMGGRGKTPVAIHLARLLAGAGHRPAVLSRGYGRRFVEDGAVIVSDGMAIRADLDRSGDEPMLIALSATGAAVVVCEQRTIAAALAADVLGTTVHILDDGFQHRQVARDVDIVIVTAADLDDRRLPFGRLREPVAALLRADAIVFDGFPPASMPASVAEVVGTKPLYSLRRMLGDPVALEPDQPWLARRGPALAMAGIAGPERFTTSLTAAGWSIVGLAAFRDHHRYSGRDIAAVTKQAHDAGVNAVVTTEKDAMRLLPLRPLPIPMASVPLDVILEPLEFYGQAPGSVPPFRDWLALKLGFNEVHA